jgi:hypothetical protein
MGKSGLLLVFGASGVGKTSAVRALAARPARAELRCVYFDDIGIPSNEVMCREFGGPEAWQAQATNDWVRRIAAQAMPGSITVLEGQTRPSFLRAALARYATLDTFSNDVTDLEMRGVLLDCRARVRRGRVVERGQPELSNPQMDDWAIYLRGQADALSIPVIDTTDLLPEAVTDALEREVEALRAVLIGLGPG